MAKNDINHHGTVLEKQIEALLVSKGYLKLTPPQATSMMAVPWFVPQYRKFTTLFKTQMRLDFLIYHPIKWPDKLACEVKYQGVPGSVDEKLPYVVESLLGVPEPMPCIILLAGGGYRKEAVEWLKSQQNGRLTVLEGMDRIIKWAHIEL